MKVEVVETIYSIRPMYLTIDPVAVYRTVKDDLRLKENFSEPFNLSPRVVATRAWIDENGQ